MVTPDVAAMRGWVVLGLLALAGCVAEPAPIRPVAVPRPDHLTPYQQCLGSLDELGIEFQEVPAFVGAKGCGLTDGVKVAAEGVDLNRPTALSCELAVAFANFEYEWIEPLAQRYLKQSITRVYHAGTYACRDIRGRKELSEHAHGRAIDVLGFDLADHTVINVEHDWRGPGPKSQFLRAVAKAACRRFDVVLTPDHDRDHRDHLHLDLSGKKFCS
jgi:hypothetical protein